MDMLSWICPECGRECDGNVRACPACAQGDLHATRMMPAGVADTRETEPAPEQGLIPYRSSETALARPRPQRQQRAVREYYSPAAQVYEQDPEPCLAEPVPVPAEPKRPVSRWAVSAGGALLALWIGTWTVWNVKGHDGDGSPPEAVSVLSQPAPAPLPAAAEKSPLPVTGSEAVEVTGVRITVDEDHHSRVQYLVVNHSAVDLKDVAVSVTLRPGGPGTGANPLCRFAARVPALPAHGSQELRTDLGDVSGTVPDWQQVRLETEISTAQ